MCDIMELREVIEKKHFENIGECTKKYKVDRLNRKQKWCEIYDENNCLYKSSFYIDNLKHGYIEIFHKGTKKLSNRNCYLKGKLKYKERYDNNGNIFEHIEYDENKKNGAYLMYYADGKLFSRGICENGVFEGNFEYFYNNDNNTIKKIFFYEKGKIKSYIKFSDKGEIIEEK